MTSHFALLAICVILLCCSATCENVAHNVTTRGVDALDLYENVKGDWAGSMELQFDCNSAVHPCAFEVLFGDDFDFYMSMGSGCFQKNGRCYTENGKVTNITEDEIHVEYECPSGGQGCFCNSSSKMSLCWRYTKKVMDLNLGVPLNPLPAWVSPTCPIGAKQYCKNETGENVGLGLLECSQGNCLVCRAAIECKNRGKCDRSGQCVCFHGFSGPDCSVSACPGGCHGHGICDISKTKILLGMSIFDKSSHAGVCRCFAGWSGPDCSAADIYTGRQALWQGLIFIGVVTTVLTFSVVFKKFAHNSFRRRPRRFTVHRRSRRQRAHRLDVELDEFINPL